MTKHYVGEPPSRPIDAHDHGSILGLLPEYVMIHVLGQQHPPEWHVLEQHLARCAACRAEADALRDLLAASYAGALPTVPAPPPPDLPFLTQDQPQPIAQARHPGEDAPPAPRRSFPPIVIQFSPTLLPRIRVRMAARTPGVRLRYAYEIPPTDTTSPIITVEVHVRDDQPDQGLVRVCVEHADRDPFDQAGARVTLQIDAARWSGVTDQNGVTAFPDVPLDQIERWQLRIEPPEADDDNR